MIDRSVDVYFCGKEESYVVNKLKNSKLPKKKKKLNIECVKKASLVYDRIPNLLRSINSLQEVSKSIKK